jgi:succinate dehydrogenase / fumarate reductase cytochrome b subunit
MNRTFLHFSSITKKIWMAFLGLFLILFLVVHLTINLFLLRNDGGDWFNQAAHFMGTNYIIKIFEVILFGGFFLHIAIGIILQIRNWFSRPVRYKVLNRTKTPFLSKYMIYTGGIVFIFLVIHFINFYFIKLGWVPNPVEPTEEGNPDFYAVARWLFHQPFYTVLYIILFIVLGFHLYHAFQAAFQTLGLDHKKYTPLIRGFGTFYAIAVPLGFIFIPLYIFFIR